MLGSVLLPWNISRQYGTSKLVCECFIALSKLVSHYSVHFSQVSGHVGIDDNKCADALAKRGAGMLFLGSEPLCVISKDTTNHLIHKSNTVSNGMATLDKR